MEDLELGGHTYRVRRMDAFKALHVQRKLAPILLALSRGAAAQAEHLESLPAGTKAEEPAAEDKKEEASLSPEAIGAIGRVMLPVAEAIAALKDEEAEYIIKTCLSVVDRKVNDTWAPMIAKGGRLMYEDLSPGEMISLARAVIRENLGDFF